MTALHVGSRVRLCVPENEWLDGQVAEVVALEPWGAHVRTPAAATGRFRALFAEMAPLVADDGKVAVAQGFTGDLCDTCGSGQMRRVGTCLVCGECGSTTGCG